MSAASNPRPQAPDRTAFLVSTGWLEEHLDDPGLRVVDCRFYFDDYDRGRRSYLEAHIPGAHYLNWTTDISEPRGHLQFMAAGPARFRATMERLGIGDDTRVVGYDDEGGHYVARLWLLLRRYGHDNLRVLEGGWTKWQLEGRPTRSGAESALPRASFTIRDERPDLLLDAEAMVRTRDDPNTVVLDVRRRSEFTGEEVRVRHGGRIPWARWMLWQDNLRWDGARDFRPAEEIRRRYEAAGVTPDKQVVAYCHGAVRAGHTAFTLAMLGYPNVRVYDGSWEEWGSRDDLPIASGEPGGPEAGT
jgi:thiosulfate/3-mercaptopyruvate sulfurtransferase